jgi:lipoprotein-releasing system ATP-binding protein
LLRQLQSQFQTSFVVVTHDTELASKLDRSLSLVDGVLQDSTCLETA